MTRLALRRRRAATTLDLPTTAGAVALGLAAGALAGFLLGELWGPTASRAIRRPKRPVRTGSAATLVDAARTALGADPLVAASAIEVVPVGRSAIELHGWVPNRTTRARAIRHVREALPEASVIDCLLVHGEDDGALEAPHADIRSA
jgi:hypothetical protein